MILLTKISSFFLAIICSIIVAFGGNPEVIFGKDTVPPTQVEDNRSFEEIIDSGVYTLEFTLKTTDANGSTTVDPGIIAASGDKAYVSATMDNGGTAIEIQYRYNGSKAYFVIPSMRAYTEVDEDFIGELMPDLSSTVNDATLVSSAMMTVDGAAYICETYEIDGETVKYYYLNNGDLTRIETYDPETDTSTIMIIKSISGTVDESLFELPLGYISLSGLGDSYDFDNSFGEIEDEPAGFFERVIQAVLGFFSFC